MMKTFLTFLATQQLLYQTILSGVLNALFLAKNGSGFLGFKAQLCIAAELALA